MNSGKKRHRVTIVAPPLVAAPTETTIASNVAAQIEPVPVGFQSPETIQAGGVQYATRYVVTLNYRRDLTAAMVLREQCCTQRQFQIQAVMPSDRRTSLDLVCVTNG